ncbi:MAG: hypothetical protein BV457_02405 [Thermoplasmata archaeon M9B1D]|nr:MAG: hypothetical protein BV457_02405 [Thermoplasmata archaeon M9B1D]PNX49633.1 MAG: hypothetical protein BV456_08750 [Thermoplasmata archaeon M8B2D]
MHSYKNYQPDSFRYLGFIWVLSTFFADRYALTYAINNRYSLFFLIEQVYFWFHENCSNDFIFKE